MSGRQNWAMVALIVAAGVVFTFTSARYLIDRGHPIVCVGVYALLVIAGIYSRTPAGRGPLQ